MFSKKTIGVDVFDDLLQKRETSYNKQSYFLNAGPNLLALINLTLTPIFCAPGAAATVVRLADRNLIDWEKEKLH